MPVSGPGMNYYGGDRPGNNLFSNSTVALDAQTGKLKWHFQDIRHEIWDYNLPPAPGLIDIRKDGKTIPALAQVGKSGFMFILNREDGTPIHGVDERPKAKADVPGEWYPATQPIPRKPGPLARVSMTRNDLVTAEDTTPAHAEACRALWDKSAVPQRRPYTPWNYRPNGGPPTIVFPGMTGGVNWGGTATDPELGYIFVNSKDEPTTGWIAPNPRYNEKTKDTEFPYVQQSGGALSAEARDTDGRSLGTLPCFRPPWASLMAVNAATGEFVWRVPLGVNDSMPEGKKQVGSPGYGGPMVTAGGLVFIGATRDRRFRTFDFRTGKELWSVRLITTSPRSQSPTWAGAASSRSPSWPPRKDRATTSRCTCSPCPDEECSSPDAGRLDSSSGDNGLVRSATRRVATGPAAVWYPVVSRSPSRIEHGSIPAPRAGGAELDRLSWHSTAAARPPHNCSGLPDWMRSPIASTSSSPTLKPSTCSRADGRNETSAEKQGIDDVGYAKAVIADIDRMHPID